MADAGVCATRVLTRICICPGEERPSNNSKGSLPADNYIPAARVQIG